MSIQMGFNTNRALVQGDRNFISGMTLEFIRPTSFELPDRLKPKFAGESFYDILRGEVATFREIVLGDHLLVEYNIAGEVIELECPCHILARHA